jgi:hypothetical protein
MSWVYSWGRDYNYIPTDHTVKKFILSIVTFKEQEATLIVVSR